MVTGSADLDEPFRFRNGFVLNGEGEALLEDGLLEYRTLTVDGCLGKRLCFGMVAGHGEDA